MDRENNGRGNPGVGVGELEVLGGGRADSVEGACETMMIGGRRGTGQGLVGCVPVIGEGGCVREDIKPSAYLTFCMCTERGDHPAHQLLGSHGQSGPLYWLVGGCGHCD